MLKNLPKMLLGTQEKYIWSYLRYCSVDVLFTKFEHMCSDSLHMCISTHVHWYTYVLDLVNKQLHYSITYEQIIIYTLQYHIWANNYIYTTVSHMSKYILLCCGISQNFYWLCFSCLSLCLYYAPSWTTLM